MGETMYLMIHNLMHSYWQLIGLPQYIEILMYLFTIPSQLFIEKCSFYRCQVLHLSVSHLQSAESRHVRHYMHKHRRTYHAPFLQLTTTAPFNSTVLVCSWEFTMEYDTDCEKFNSNLMSYLIIYAIIGTCAFCNN